MSFAPTRPLPCDLPRGFILPASSRLCVRCSSSRGSRISRWKIGILGEELGSAVGGPFLGEVGAGEAAVVQDGGAVVGPGGIGLQVEIAERVVFAVLAILREPSITSLVVKDAFIAGGRAGFLLPIALVLGAVAEAEIEPAVVGLVAVAMVDQHALGRLHDLAVHEDRLALLAASGVAAAVHVPLPPAEPLVVGGVDVGIEAVAQRDHADVACGQGGLATVIRAGDARNVVQTARPGEMVGAPRHDGLARPQQPLHQFRIADGIHAVVAAPSGHEFSLPVQLRPAQRRDRRWSCGLTPERPPRRTRHHAV
jgi:hypothetical protein